MNVRGRLSGSGVLQQALSMRQFKHLRASGSNFAMTLKAVYAHESCALASGQHVCIYVCESVYICVPERSFMLSNCEYECRKFVGCVFVCMFWDGLQSKAFESMGSVTIGFDS